MGQLITVNAQAVADVAVFDTDRGITGQDGVGYANRHAAEDAAGFGAALAVRIFEAQADVDHVFVASNAVTVRRPGGWPDEVLADVGDVIRQFFVFYDG